MAAVNRKLVTEQVQYLLLMLGLTLALKQFYSVANAAQLQWILYPLKLALECFSNLSFEPTANSEWRDDIHGVTIVKTCAGINFLIISLMGYLWQQRDQGMRPMNVLRSILFAWITALGGNTLRILLCLHYQDALAEQLNISGAESHRLVGITVYFLCIWAQLSGFELKNFGLSAQTAVAIYLSITVVVPWVRSELLGMEPPNANHLLWVIGLPTTMVVFQRIVKNRRHPPINVAAKKSVLDELAE